MKLYVNGQVFPKVWELADRVTKLREERRSVNLGAGSVGFSVYQVELPKETKKEGIYLITPQGVRLYYYPGDQYQIGYLISEIDRDPLVKRHFGKPL